MNNNKLNIVIDPSHGGIDLGQVNNGKYEKDIILDLSILHITPNKIVVRWMEELPFESLPQMEIL